MHARALLIALAITTLGLSACGGGASLQPEIPVVIAHRGASGYLPEHTLGGYELAVRLGADYIEPDLQLTREGALVAMHDDTLERTTNVASLFAKRNGKYLVSDFTLAEIKTLTVQPTGTGKAGYPGFTPSAATPWAVPTFQEVIDLARRQSALTGRTVGIYPEAKQADPVMEDAILKTLAANGYDARSKVFIQSFSDATVRSLRAKQNAQNRRMPMILLGAAMTGTDGVARMGVIGATGVKLLELKDVATFAEGVGVVINTPAYNVSKDFITQAHAAGLKVHGWTFAQAEPSAAAAEYKQYLDMGMDGMFSNYTDLAVRARDAFVKAR